MKKILALLTVVVAITVSINAENLVRGDIYQAALMENNSWGEWEYCSGYAIVNTEYVKLSIAGENYIYPIISVLEQGKDYISLQAQDARYDSYVVVKLRTDPYGVPQIYIYYNNGKAIVFCLQNIINS